MRALLIALALVGAGCASHQAELKAAMTTLDAASSGFVAWDDTHQGDIAKHATSLAEGEAQIASYKEKRTHVLYTFNLAYRALAVAALDTSTDSLAAMAATLLELKTAITGLGGPWPTEGAGGGSGQ